MHMKRTTSRHQTCGYLEKLELYRKPKKVGSCTIDLKKSSRWYDWALKALPRLLHSYFVKKHASLAIAWAESKATC